MRVFTVLTALLTWLCGLAAWLLIILWDVETVLVTGPVLLICANAAFWVGRHARYWPGFVIGIVFVCACILFFTLVQVYDWMPSDADQPFTILGAIIVSLTAPLAILCIVQPPRSFAEWQCQQCGYPVHYADVTRCPECGTTVERPATHSESSEHSHSLEP